MSEKTLNKYNQPGKEKKRPADEGKEEDTHVKKEI